MVFLPEENMAQNQGFVSREILRYHFHLSAFCVHLLDNNHQLMIVGYVLYGVNQRVKYQEMLHMK